MISDFKLKLVHFDKKTKLEVLPDYYECPICMSLIEHIYECPTCKGRSCKPCLVSFSKAELSKHPSYEA